MLIALMLVKMNWFQVTAEEYIFGNQKCVIEPWMHCERNVKEDGWSHLFGVHFSRSSLLTVYFVNFFSDCLPYSIEACKRAAKSLGYDLGGYGYPFVGEGLFYTPGKIMLCGFQDFSI